MRSTLTRFIFGTGFLLIKIHITSIISHNVDFNQQLNYFHFLFGSSNYFITFTSYN